MATLRPTRLGGLVLGAEGPNPSSAGSRPAPGAGREQWMPSYASTADECGDGASCSVSPNAVAISGTGGGVPPNSGHNDWKLHQSHSLLGLARQSPVRARSEEHT